MSITPSNGGAVLATIPANTAHAQLTLGNTYQTLGPANTANRTRYLLENWPHRASTFATDVALNRPALFKALMQDSDFQEYVRVIEWAPALTANASTLAVANQGSTSTYNTFTLNNGLSAIGTGSLYAYASGASNSTTMAGSPVPLPTGITFDGATGILTFTAVAVGARVVTVEFTDIVYPGSTHAVVTYTFTVI